jgi:hypothetical protein
MNGRPTFALDAYSEDVPRDHLQGASWAAPRFPDRYYSCC